MKSYAGSEKNCYEKEHITEKAVTKQAAKMKNKSSNKRVVEG